MRILILGPIVNERTSGGVAVFDEGLYHGFNELGDFAQIISIDKSSSIDNLVAGKPTNKKHKIFFRFRRIAKLIKKFEPDLVISSVQYSIGIKKYKRKWPKATYVQVLHGTPCPVNGIFKAWCINFAARYSRKHFDKLVTVSHLSWAINKKINRVECDEIINTGCIPPSNFNGSKEKKYDFCYVGRLVKDKNIEKMMDSLIEIQKERHNLKVCIAGYGELEHLFYPGGKYDLDFVTFKGKVEHPNVFSIYSDSKFFISLCELEACGLAFSEAAICGCNPVSALSSGQTYLFRGKPFYHTIDTSNVNIMTAELKMVLDNHVEITKGDIGELIEIFSFKNIAKKYKNLVEL